MRRRALEVGVDLVKYRGWESADGAENRERSGRDENEDERVLDERLPFFAETQGPERPRD